MTDERRYVSGLEQDQVSRALLMWLNQYPEKPVSRIEFEYLSDAPGLSVSSITAPFKISEYISGAYEAQYQFAVLYRIKPNISGERLNAVELLDNLGKWAEAREDKPALGAGKTVTMIERNSTATMIARYDDGTEDYQVLLNMIYEVKNNG